MSSDIVQFTLSLTGSMEGQSKTINGLTFSHGHATVRGSATEIAGVIKYFTKCYQVKAIPGGMEHGTSEIHTPSEQGKTEEVPSEIRQDGSRPEEETTVHIGSDDGTESGSTRTRTDRDGYGHSRVSEKDRFNVSSSNSIDPEKLLKVLKELDPAQDDQWNLAGLPKLTTVSERYGSEGITRKDIESVWPEFKRNMTI